MAVSREYVISAFLEHLGREPESQAISSHIALGSESEVTKAITRSREYFKRKFKGVSFESGAKHKIVIIGNCQVAVIGKLIEAMSPETSVISIGLEESNPDGLASGNLDISQYVEESSHVFIQTFREPFASRFFGNFPLVLQKHSVIPSISYSAFHPDMGYIETTEGSYLSGPLGDYHSLLCFWAWQKGYSAQEAVKLFRYEVFRELGYLSQKSSSDTFLINIGKSVGIDMQAHLNRWAARGCFMHSLNHPKLFVLADMARFALAREGIAFAPGIENYLSDDLAVHPCWDVYPDIARNFNIEGSYSFKKGRGMGTSSRPAPMLSLDEFVKASFENYNSYPGEVLRPIVELSAFERLEGFLKEREQQLAGSSSVSKKSAGGNPYLKLKSYQLWRRGVEAAKPQDVDPVVSSAMHLTQSSKVATAGSCFAQHISRTLSNNGFTYFVAEPGDASVGDQEELAKLNYGVYSARYGNLYTSRQLVQLFDRAYGKFKPLDSAWLRKDGRYVDPFRPMINPDGHTTEAEVEEARAEHLKHVRHMFESLDVFVFTLGLTESWRRREDGAVFPLAPGVAGGGMDSVLYEFVNFETHDVVADLEYFLCELARVNPEAKVIFTVSPVPLVATYEDRHVLTSTTYSKSALRSAADYIVRRYSQAEYFPSYEIITGNYNKGAYFETDLRSVREEGVSHVMRLFMEHYSSEATPKSSNDKPRDDLEAELLRAAEKNNSVVCEEEALDPGSN